MADQDWKELYKKQLAQKSAKQTRGQKYAAATDEEPAKEQTSPETHPPRAKHSAPAELTSGYWQRIIAKALIIITIIQVIVWLVIALFSGRFPEPWWLWTASGGAVVLVIWHVAAKGNAAKKGDEKS